MKYAYLLQTVRGVPLGFDFSLYAYGPYDASVLSRISTAERWDAVEERVVHYPSGTGYEIHPGSEIGELFDLAGDFLKPYEGALDWVVEEFRSYTAAGMELIGTMVYADREAAAEKVRRTKAELVDTVLKIKPRFSPEQAEQIYNKLKGLGILIAT
jgi:hypothetical protein